jgi:hypothetical protein
LTAVLLAPAALGMTLADKAAVFEHDMEARFLLEGQALCKLKLPTPEREFIDYNMPDNAYMTGIYLGAMAMKYAATMDPQDRLDVQHSLNALHLLCTVSGKKGLLARAAWPKDRPKADDGEWHASPDGKHLWRGDVSSDQMTGAIYGFAVAYELAATDDEKKVIAQCVGDLVDHLLENDLRIIDIDGQPTQWGSYYPDYVKRREPMNALLLLQHLKVAHHVTGEPRFSEAYHRLGKDEGYFELAVQARRLADPRRVNHSDDVLIFLAYYPLLALEQDAAIRKHYVDSLRRSWHGDERFPGVAPEANPFYTFMAKKWLEQDVDVEPAINTLRWFPLDMKWNPDTVANYEQEFSFAFDPAVQSPEPEAGKPVPVDRRPKTWSAWVQNPYQQGPRHADPGMEYNGHDYLAGYWLGRYFGFIPAAASGG